jgi:benzoyl-CoA reductase/2-hydroxyglutaryl-CoA dehydratase subunit BcrC/BadD/HgdB
MGLKDQFLKILTQRPDIKKIRRGISLSLLQTILTPKRGFPLRADKRYSLILYNHVRKFFRSNGGVVYTSLFAPTELIYGFGLIPFSLEMFAGIAAVIGIAPAFLQRSDSLWMSTDLCSFHRAYMGLADAGLLPQPLFLLATSHTCDGTFKSFSMVSRSYGKPLLFLDTPYGDTDDAVRYLAEQLVRTRDRIEEITGKNFSYSELERSFFHSNRARKALKQVNEARRELGPVVYGDDFIKLILAWGSLFGHPQGARLFEGYRDEVERQQTKGLGKVRAKRRILWLHLKPFFDNDLIRYLERELGAVIVFEEINQVYWEDLDIKTPWESLAKRLLSNYWVGPTERRLYMIKKMIEDYSVDGVIHFAHWGCRQSNGAVRLIKDTVQKCGIPFLNIDGDCIEERNSSEGQLKTRIDGFMELLG